MKKLLCMMMAVMMALLCAGSVGESAEENETVPFVQIREDVTAQAYSEAGGSQAIDSLPGGSLCGLIEKVTADGDAWYHILYLNNEKKAAEGAIRAEDAKQLTTGELRTLLEDMERANEVLDLIDALNDYIKIMTGGTDGGTGTEGEKPQDKGELEKLYDEAMQMLTGLFSTDIGEELGKLTGKGDELLTEMVEKAPEILKAAEEVGTKLQEGAEKLGDELQKTGEELLKEAEETGGDLLKTGEELLKEVEKTGPEELEDTFRTLREKLQELEKKLTEAPDLQGINSGDLQQEITDLLEKITKAQEDMKLGEDAEELEKEIQSMLEKLDKYAGEGVGSLIDEIVRLADQVKEKLESAEFTMAREFIVNLGDMFRQEGLIQSVQAIGTLAEFILPSDLQK